MQDGAEKMDTTKTRAGVRDVPIHPHLVPMIEAMRSSGRVFPVARVRDVEGRVAELRALGLRQRLDRCVARSRAEDDRRA